MYNPNTFVHAPASFFYDGIVCNFTLLNPFSTLTATKYLFFDAAILLKQWVT
ncbi:MAG: hypothetical protein SFU99_13505 [Saprospiraceae bacterium]|nr:hypothetical protein [Saprospiraceae bacterium]